MLRPVTREDPSARVAPIHLRNSSYFPYVTIPGLRYIKNGRLSHIDVGADGSNSDANQHPVLMGFLTYDWLEPIPDSEINDKPNAGNDRNVLVLVLD